MKRAKKNIENVKEKQWINMLTTKMLSDKMDKMNVYYCVENKNDLKIKSLLNWLCHQQRTGRVRKKQFLHQTFSVQYTKKNTMIYTCIY